MTKPHIEIDITIQDMRWKEAISDIDSIIDKIALKVLHDELTGIEAAEISIVLGNDAFIQIFNKSYRGKDAPTNVLSFPMSEPEDLKTKEATFYALGDIIMAYETITRESEEQGKSLKDHITHMLVHGCLHLLHYDHLEEEDAENMERLEIKILEELGIKNPYE